MQLGTAAILCGWHCEDTLQLALPGYFAVGQCKDTLRLGTAGILCAWALRDTWVGHCRDTLRLGTARILSGWALQGYLVVGH